MIKMLVLGPQTGSLEIVVIKEAQTSLFFIYYVKYHYNWIKIKCLSILSRTLCASNFELFSNQQAFEWKRLLRKTIFYLYTEIPLRLILTMKHDRNSFTLVKILNSLTFRGFIDTRINASEKSKFRSALDA